MTHTKCNIHVCARRKRSEKDMRTTKNTFFKSKQKKALERGKKRKKIAQTADEKMMVVFWACVNCTL